MTVTEQRLCAAASSCVSWADSNEALQAAYPSWLDEDGCDLATIYQRLSRARRDVRLLLTSIVNRADLSPVIRPGASGLGQSIMPRMTQRSVRFAVRFSAGPARVFQ